MRYSELSRRLAGVSQKMLTQTLRSLERDGLLTRTVTPTVPVTVTYELTDLGLSLQQLMHGLKDWAESHMGEVLDEPIAVRRPRGVESHTEISAVLEISPFWRRRSPACLYLVTLRSEAQPLATRVVPARHGTAVRVRAGQLVRVTDPYGGQVGDLFAFVDDGARR